MKNKITTALCTILCSQLACNTINWSFPPEVLSSSSLSVADPQIAMDANGNAVAVWMEDNVVKARSKNVDMGWGAETVLSGPMASSPRVVSDLSGNAIAVWIDGGKLTAASKPLNGSWSAPEALSKTGASSPDLAVNGSGDAIAVWARNGDVQTSTKQFGGNWQSAATIQAQNALLPRIGMGGSGSNKRSVVVWQAGSGSSRAVYASTKVASGAWSSPQAISDLETNAGFGDVAVDQFGNVTAVWYQYEVANGNYSNVVVRAAKRPLSGAWSRSVPLSAPGIRNPAALTLRIAHDGAGNAVALWNTSFDDSTISIQSAVRLVQMEWSAPVDLVRDNLYSYDFDVSATAFGDALAAYMFYNGSALLIQSADSNVTGYMKNLWSVPLNLSFGLQNGFPRIAAAATGSMIHAAAVWIATDGMQQSVVSSVGQKALVLPPSNLSVVQNGYPFGVFTEYANMVSWQASNDPNVAGYLVYRNGVLIGQTSGATLQYTDNNRVQNAPVTYGVAAIDNQQSTSAIIPVQFP